MELSPMSGPQPQPIELNDRQRAILEQLTRAQTDPQRLVRRAGLILIMAADVNDQQAARQARHDRETAGVWRTRWLGASPRLAVAEARVCSDKELSPPVEAVLDDEPRPGTPATFTAEQLTQLLAQELKTPARVVGRLVIGRHANWRTKRSWAKCSCVFPSAMSGVFENNRDCSCIAVASG
jgi:putative transposase